MAATDGIDASPGLGRIALAHRAATLPGVSDPSSVVRSMQRIARSSAHSFEDFLIERLASDAARSSAPTSSTLRTPRISEPRWVNDSAVAMLGLCAGGRIGPGLAARTLLTRNGQTRQPPFDGWVTGAPYRCRPTGTGGGALVGLPPQPLFGCLAAGRSTWISLVFGSCGLFATTSLTVSAGPMSL